MLDLFHEGQCVKFASCFTLIRHVAKTRMLAMPLGQNILMGQDVGSWAMAMAMAMSDGQFATQLFEANILTCQDVGGALRMLTS